MSDTDVYLIWSNEHRGWWRSGECGYTSKLSEAGHYMHATALRICTRAIPGAGRLGTLPELPVRLLDVRAMRTAYRDTHPNVPVEPWE